MHETLSPTSTCTPPHDDYDYDCDVNRGPTFNHAHTGISLLPPWPSTMPVDRRARCSSLRFLMEIERAAGDPYDRNERQRWIRIAILMSMEE